MKTIMDMALEAGFTEREIIRAVDNITRFAAFVRADEREACADAVRFADNGTEAAEIIRAKGNT